MDNALPFTLDGDEVPSERENNKIELSQNTNGLLMSLKSIKPRLEPDDLSKLSVSQTVSFLAIAYEKVRNAVEYREDHLVLRAAIERILKRRLALNPEAKAESENLLRELTWARYFPNESLGDLDIEEIQKILDAYTHIRKELLEGKYTENQSFLWQYLFEFLTCEIEETLNPSSSARNASFTFFIFQTLKDKIKVEGLDKEKQDAFLLVAIEKVYRKSDLPYQRYHLFTTFYKPLSKFNREELKKITPSLPAIFKKVDELLKGPYSDNLAKFVKKQLPPYLILFDVLNKKRSDLKSILTDSQTLWYEVEKSCKEKYRQIGTRLRTLALRSLIYIFITKMILALLLEYPVSRYFYGDAHRLSIIINSLLPPLLMLVIVLFFKLPGEENTKKVYNRIINIIDADKSFETQVAYMRKKIRDKNSLRVFVFTIVYTLTFFITLSVINQILTLLNFNLISQALFIFFISVVSFFSYRIKQVASEYKLDEREGPLTPVIDFFFLPILSIGRFFSRELGRLNVFILLFDFIIEAPFKLIIEIFEEWIKFVKARKEEIV